MARHVDDSVVLFGLLRFQIGEGTFKRNKIIFVHFNGDVASPSQRGRLNSRKQVRYLGYVYLDFLL